VDLLEAEYGCVRTRLSQHRHRAAEHRPAAVRGRAASKFIIAAGYSVVRAIPVKGHLLGYRLRLVARPILWTTTLTFCSAPPDSHCSSTEESAGFDRTWTTDLADITSGASALWPELASHTPDEAGSVFVPTPKPTNSTRAN